MNIKMDVDMDRVIDTNMDMEVTAAMGTGTGKDTE